MDGWNDPETVKCKSFERRIEKGGKKCAQKEAKDEVLFTHV